jgi:hypothetical protein
VQNVLLAANFSVSKRQNSNFRALVGQTRSFVCQMVCLFACLTLTSLDCRSFIPFSSASEVLVCFCDCDLGFQFAVCRLSILNVQQPESLFLVSFCSCFPWRLPAVLLGMPHRVQPLSAFLFDLPVPVSNDPSRLPHHRNLRSNVQLVPLETFVVFTFTYLVCRFSWRRRRRRSWGEH